MNVQTKQKGFTIIEVVLVLAIAGLIFLVVFLALPALQRNQRDTQRRSDVGRALAAIQTYQSNKNGKLPTSVPPAVAGYFTAVQPAAGFVVDYLTTGGSAFDDPSGGPYKFAVLIPAATSPNAFAFAAGTDNITNGSLAYKIGNTCNNTAKASAISIVAKLEGGGTYCANN